MRGIARFRDFVPDPVYGSLFKFRLEFVSRLPRALEFAKVLRPGRLIDRGWPLRSHKKAIEHAPKAARAGHAKTVFEIAA